MRLKLINVKTDIREVQIGNWETGYSSIFCEHPLFVFQKDNGRLFPLEGYFWEFGEYDQVCISSYIDFARFVSEQTFEEDTEFDYMWLWGLADSYEKSIKRSTKNETIV